MMEKHQKMSDYLDLVQSHGKYWITKSDAMKTLKITDPAFRKAVNRLVKQDKLVRIRNGFYVIVPPEYRATKGLPPTHYIDALMKFLKQPYYIGMLSASALHGTSHQSPQELQVVTSKVIPLIEVGQSRIRFVTKKDVEKTPIQKVKTPTGYVNTSTPSATIFDLLRYIRIAGHLNNATTVIVEMMENINTTELTKIAKQEKDASHIQRLGFLIDHFSKNEIASRELYKLIEKKNPSYTFLRADKRKGILKKDDKWNVLVNTIVEPDL